jgi:molybdate transport system substrate-binding protein
MDARSSRARATEAAGPGSARGTLAALALTLSAGCARPAPAELTVFAAASLQDAFGVLAHRFEAEHPGVSVRCSFAGSQELRAQLERGADADVFAAADARHLEALRAAGRVEAPRVFAENALAVVVPADARPGGPELRKLEDLGAAERIVLGAEETPIGRYTERFLRQAQAVLGEEAMRTVRARVVSRELNVRQVLAKVSLGEADVGIVYRSDARAASGSVRELPLPPSLEVRAEYPIARVSDSGHRELAEQFIDLVLSAEGRRALKDAGFLVPERPAIPSEGPATSTEGPATSTGGPMSRDARTGIGP